LQTSTILALPESNIVGGKSSSD